MADELVPERMLLVLAREGEVVIGLPDEELLAVVEERPAFLGRIIDDGVLRLLNRDELLSPQKRSDMIAFVPIPFPEMGLMTNSIFFFIL